MANRFYRNEKPARRSGRADRFSRLSLEMLNALAAGSVFPLLLEHPVIAAKGLVKFGSSGLSGS